MSNTNNCPICYYNIDSSEYVIIKHSKCKYYIHTECFKLYPKCIYCKADLNQTNDIHEHLMNIISIMLNTFDNSFLGISRELLSGPDNLEWKLMIFFLKSFISTFTFFLPLFAGVYFATLINIKKLSFNIIIISLVFAIYYLMVYQMIHQMVY